MARTDRAAGLVTGTVVRLTANGPIVEVPRIAPGYEEGPLLTTVANLAPGDKVILSALAHDPDTLIVVGLVGGAHKHDAADLTTGVVDLARLPVTASGVSSATKLVRADDSRLSNARTPTAHNHDDLYYTEAETNALLDGTTRRLAATDRAGTATYIRVAVVDGIGATAGTAVSLIVAGQGNYGSARRATTIINYGQRGDSVAWFDAFTVGSTTTPWTWFQKQISTYKFELWALRPTFENRVAVTDLNYRAGSLSQVTMDLESATNPGGLTALPAPLQLGGGAWLDWTPAWTAGVTTGNGTWLARYVRNGNTVQGWARFTLGSTSAITGVPQLTLPIAPVTSYLPGNVQLEDSGSTYYMADLRYTNSGLLVYARGTNGGVLNISATVPFTWAVNDKIEVRFAYEVAPL